MRLRPFTLLTLSLCASLSAAAQGSTSSPEAGKTYLIHRNGNANAYLYEQGSLAYASAAANTQKQYWRFVPTGEADRYYVQNVTSGRYLQSTHIGESQQVSLGSSPVVYEVKRNTYDGSLKGYYYLCSTDQPIDAGKDGTLGLNFQESSGKVVAYHIRYNRANSYWDIVETPYDYEAPQSSVHTALAKRLGIYDQPCGSLGTAWLRQVAMTGKGVTRPLNYQATTAPTDYWMPVRKDSLCIVRDTTFHLAYEASGGDALHAVTAYFDWDGDGVFETSHSFGAEATGEADIRVPDTAKVGKVRLRLRLTDNELEGADDEVHGTIYDFMVYIAAKPAIPTGLTTAQHSEGHTAGKAYGLDGRPVSLMTHKGIYIHDGHKRIK